MAKNVHAVDDDPVILPPALREEAERLAEAEGVTLESLIAAALADRLRVTKTERYFGRRAERGDPAAALEALQRLSGDEVPRAGDEA